jgi:hypothetical protein
MLLMFLASEKGCVVDGFVEGDDGLYRWEGEDSPTVEDFKNLGFSIKLNRITDPGEGGFCGIYTTSTQMLRDPVRFLSKFGWTTSDLYGGPLVMSQLLRAKALSACYETPHCPIVGVIAREALKRTRGVDPRWDRDLYHERLPPSEFVLPEFQPTLETRELFSRLFGVGLSEQLRLEDDIRRGDLSTLVGSLRIHPDVMDFTSKYVVVT